MAFTSRRLSVLLKRSPISHRPVVLVGVMALFWTIFDATLSYLTPLFLEEKQFNELSIGLIIGFSSLTGAVFDFLVSKVFTNTSYRRVFLLMLAICAGYPIVLHQASTVSIFLVAMALWGIYYDLWGFGIFNFVSATSLKRNFTKDFGFVQIMRSLGSIIAPLVVGVLVINVYDWKIMVFSWANLFVACAAFAVLILIAPRQKNGDIEEVPVVEKRSWNLLTWKNEVLSWRKVGKVIAPALVVTLLYYMNEAFFWTIGPLYGEAAGSMLFGGLFLAADTTPGLLVGWYVHRFTLIWGKKRVAFLALLCGGLILGTFGLITNPWAHIIIVLCSSLFLSMSIPAINGAFADYIVETPELEKEIEGLEDFSFNVAYVIGPVVAGGLAQWLTIPWTFTAMGVIEVIVAVILILTAPKHIRVPRLTEINGTNVAP